MGERPQDRGAAPEERREARCALILVDLDVPADVDDDALRVALARWAQETRFTAVCDVDGVRAGDARGVVIRASLEVVSQALAASVR